MVINDQPVLRDVVVVYQQRDHSQFISHLDEGKEGPHSLSLPPPPPTPPNEMADTTLHDDWIHLMVNNTRDQTLADSAGAQATTQMPLFNCLTTNRF